MLDDHVVWSTQTTMYSLPPQGRQGGLDAKTAECVINPETARERKLEAYGTAILNKGDVIELRSAGGGGYGDPRLRDRRYLEEDIKNGLISVERARAEYGFQEEGENEYGTWTL